MSLFEYEARMYAYQLKEIDQLFYMHLSAWLNQVAGSKKENGKPRFRSFDKFFDYEKEIKNIKGRYISSSKTKNLDEKDKRLARIAAKINK